MASTELSGKTRICYKCKQEKELREFIGAKKEKYGKGYLCKRCASICREDAYKNMRESNLLLEDKRKQFNIPEYSVGTKRCCRCGVEKDILTEFPKNICKKYLDIE